MIPKVFISDAFFNFFQDCVKEVRKNLVHESDFDGDIELFDNFKTIKSIFSNWRFSHIQVDISKKEVLKLFKKKGSNSFDSLKETICFQAIKNNRFDFGKQFQNVDVLPNSIFFLAKNEIELFNNLNDNNNIVITENFFETKFYTNVSFPAEGCDTKVIKIKECNHPFGGMIIIDPYLFEDRRQIKIPNLIQLIKNFIRQNENKVIEISILTKNPYNNSLLEKKFNEIKKSFDPDKISLHIYAPDSIGFSDRYFITNYAAVVVGHPLDRPSYISSNFFPSKDSIDEINRSFTFWKEKVLEVYREIKKTPQNLSSYKCIYKTDNSIHKIFNSININH